MTEKIKVSREVADAIEYAKREGYDYETIMKIQIKNGWERKETAPLLKLTLRQLATALIDGYKVELTPHEIIANEYRRTVKEAVDGQAGRFKLTELGIEKRKSFVEGIEYTLNTLKITIKGVNDHDN